MTFIFARRGRLHDGWARNIRIEVVDGHVGQVATGSKPERADVRVDTVLPALSNVHSHTFQRAMAGMTESRQPGRDSFWTWRELMYRFMAHITPAQYEAIAALAFMEMQEAGFAAVGEFHYVHHQPGGQTHSNLIELSDRVFAASTHTGIGLTHLPVLYTYGGARQQALTDSQQRFGNDNERYADIVTDCRHSAAQHLPADTRVGIAPHSLRATSPDDLQAVLSLRSDAPIHMHIAEQPKEVTDIVDWLGAPPVQWLLANAPVDEQWCLIHATHMTPDETRNVARSGAVIGLCPMTEANLGDGPFNGPGFLASDGAFGIGSDSNIRISPLEELRTLEYSQRLRDRHRNVMVRDGGSVGEALYLGAAAGGAQALGRNAGQIQPGALADLVAIDSTATTLCALRDEQLLDGLCFAADNNVITDVWSAGRHQVRNGVHVARDAIVATYRQHIATLITAIADGR